MSRIRPFVMAFTSLAESGALLLEVAQFGEARNAAILWILETETGHTLECLYNKSSGTISSSDSSGLRRSPHSRQVQISRAVHLKDSFFNLPSTVGPTGYTANTRHTQRYR